MTTEPVALTLKEILRQPESWQQAIEITGAQAPDIRNQLLEAGPDSYLFTGCGSSYYLSIAAAGFFQEVTGLPARAVPASELILSAGTHVPKGRKVALFAFSRSGETTETVVALRRHQEEGRGPSVGITCRDTCAMAGLGSFTISLPAADDQSVVMTSSFTTMLLASLLIAADLSGDHAAISQLAGLPGVLRSQLEGQMGFGQRMGRDDSLKRFIFLGLGPFYGLACEAMLKLKEMTQVPSEAYSPLDFRHGPISVVEPGTTAVLLGTDRAMTQELQVLADIRKLGGGTSVLGGQVDPSMADHTYSVGNGLTEVARALLYMPILQATAYYRALLLGRDPDRPQHLTQVVTLDARSLESVS